MNSYLRKIVRKEYIILGIITAALIMTAFFIFSITAKSVTRFDNEIWNSYYKPLEDEFVTSARHFLNEEGFRNSGVTLTHTTDDELNRCYTLSVHHKRFNDITEYEKEEVIESLTELGFSDERCTIIIEFI